MTRFFFDSAQSRWLRMTLAWVVLFWAIASAMGHFVYIVPGKEAGSIQIVLSEELAPDEEVRIDQVAPLKLWARVDGKDFPVATTKTEHALNARLPKGTSVAFGSVVYGSMTRGDKTSLLVYHPKLVVANSPDKNAVVADKLPLEIVTKAEGAQTKFQLLFKGKPLADAAGSILLPDGKKEALKTDKQGWTAGFSGKGRYGLWLRHTIAQPGEHAGKKYSEERHYATLVGEFSAAPTSKPAAASMPPLPRAVSSLGAIASDGYLYVYGGHASKTHTYSTKDVLGTFQRVALDGGKSWESLPPGPILQGMNLAAHRGKIIRVGGMQPRNEPGQPADNHSVASCARFDPETNRWTDLPALPAPRSSHDVVVAGDKLVVVGGWQLKGKGADPVWHDTALVLDLSRPQAQWEAIPQPFQRRALTAAALGHRVYVLGGFDEFNSATKGVDILDLTTLKWSAGPEIPGDEVGFSPAATTVKDQIWVNTYEGPLYRLASDGHSWQKLATASRGRMVHRLVPHGKGVWLVGGASKGGNVAELEFLVPSPENDPPRNALK